VDDASDAVQGLRRGPKCPETVAVDVGHHCWLMARLVREQQSGWRLATSRRRSALIRSDSPADRHVLSVPDTLLVRGTVV